MSKEVILNLSTDNLKPKPSVYDQESTLFDLYRVLFRALRFLGVLPYSFDPIILKVQFHPINFQESTHIILNGIFLGYMIFRQISFFLMNYFTDFQFETMENGFMIQILWILGSCLFSSVFFGLALNYENIADTLSMWIRLEKYILHHLSSDPAKELARKTKILKYQFMFYTCAWFFAIVFLFGLNYLIDRMPAFLISVLPEWFLEDARTLPTLIRGILPFPESYLAYMCWSVLGGFDVILSTIARSCQDSIHSIIHSPPTSFSSKYHAYKSLEFLVFQVNRVFSKVIMIQQTLSFGTTIFLLYGAIKTRNSIILTGACLFNGIAFPIRIAVLYSPMAEVKVRSERIKKSLVQDAGHALGKRELRACRQLAFRATDMHKISYTAILQYWMNVVSNVITALQI